MATDTGAEKQAAERYNQWLAGRVNRWVRLRGALSMSFAILGALIWYRTGTPLFGLPFLLLAAMLFFLFLDAVGRLREINSRTWQRLTPRSAASRSTSTQAHQASGQSPSGGTHDPQW